MIKTNMAGVDLIFETSDTLFSPKKIDAGTLAMLSKAEFKPDDKVLDLGCGYGVVGIFAAKLIGPEHVVMSDIAEDAVSISRKNAILNGVKGISVYESDALSGMDDNDFTVILSNPPYHADFSVPKRFIEKGFNRLKLGGRMYMVTKRKQWYFNKFKAIFGGVKLYEVNGYFVFMAIKMDNSYANHK